MAGIASAGVLVVTGVAGAGAIAYRQLDNNIVSKDLTSLIGPRPDKSTAAGDNQPVNILLMGSDIRTGAGNTNYGSSKDIEGARSDTAILLHVSADRKNAFAVSIPRDSMVDLPSCKNAQGVMVPAKRDRFNEAFNIGGPACTIKAVESLTGVYVDHYMVVDFQGFKGVVDALDGVEVCLNQPVSDEKSGLNLPAGKSVVKGEDALAFVRARYTLGDGSDLGRIERQQDFLSSAVRKATSMQVLSNPVTLYRVLDNVTKSLTTDPELADLANLQDLATSMSSIKPSDVTFLTVPVVDNDDKATVLWVKSKADPLWAAMKSDTPWPPKPTVPEGQSALTQAPETIRVRVLNGTSTPGRAEAVAQELTNAGYKVVDTGSFPDSNVAQTQVAAFPSESEDARTVAYALNSKAQLAGGTEGLVTVVVGNDYSGVRSVVVQPKPAVTDGTTPAPERGAPKNAAQVICS